MKDFGWAIEQLKNGKKVARDGWNGKGMFLVLADGCTFDGKFQECYSEDSIIKSSEPFIVMFTAGRVYQAGWLASQADMLSVDWDVIR